MIFSLLFLTIVLLFVIWCKIDKLINCLITARIRETEFLMDSFVDFIVEKAVIIAFCSDYVNDKETGVKENKQIDYAMNIIADVMLQHGLLPKNYNLDALILVARHKLSI